MVNRQTEINKLIEREKQKQNYRERLLREKERQKINENVQREKKKEINRWTARTMCVFVYERQRVKGDW